MKLKVTKFKSVKSTNDKAIKLIQNGKVTSGFIIADLQTKGRGTMGKKWISKKGNIFISIFFKVNFTKIKIENFLIINARIIKIIYFDDANKQFDQIKNLGISTTLLLSSLILVTFFAYPSFLNSIVKTLIIN